MGYMRDHALVVSSWDGAAAEAARIMAAEFGLADLMTETVEGRRNGHQSFMIAPDGSKEGWDASDEADEQRDRFVMWLDGQRYSDDSSALRWVLVQFADDDHSTRIICDSDSMRPRVVAPDV